MSVGIASVVTGATAEQHQPPRERPAPRHLCTARSHDGAGVRPGPRLGTVLALAGLGLLVAVARDRAGSAPHGDVRGLRDLRRGTAILAGSIMVDSAMEHFQGGFHNPAMYVAPCAAAATMIASLGEGGRGAGAVQVAATLAGFAGLGFHSYNILKRPGGLSWNNLFYAAPIGAPGALAIAGLLSLGARRLAGAGGGGRPLAAITGGALMATTAEVALLHFRGAFHNPAMFLPVTIPPAAGTALCLAGLRTNRGPAPRRVARALLRLTALLGPVGTAFHAFGVAREMGGWENWRQSMLSGPPMPAPASLTGLSLAGLAALDAMRRGGHE